MTPIRLTLVAALALFGTSAAMAQAAPMVTDADGNGSFSIDEIQAAYPDTTAELYAQIDANGDGAVSADELAAAVDGGLLPSGN